MFTITVAVANLDTIEIAYIMSITASTTIIQRSVFSTFYVPRASHTFFQPYRFSHTTSQFQNTFNEQHS